MKKVLFTILITILFIGYVNASDYSCEILGDDIIYSNSDKTSYISVNIENISEISSLRMYIKYDNLKYSANSCQFLNYNLPSCSLRVNDESLIFYDYNYNEEYSLEDYPFFYASFISNDKTPTNGQSKIKVYFEDVKDKNNNNIEISECNKTFTFEEGSGKTDTISDSLNVIIKGYKFDFDDKKYEYNLKVDNDVNTLDINISVPENYEYNVTGATDLNSFGNKVIINIKNDKNEEKEYTINVLREKSNTQITSFSQYLKNIFNKVKKILPFILGIIIVLIIALLIVSKKDNKKMNKYLDKL